MLRGNEEMITLGDACKIATNYFNKHNLFIRNNCRDLGDSWIFGWGWKNAPEEIDTGGWFLRIDKNKGHTTDFDLGTPHEENFKQFMKAPKIDISDYI